MIRRFWRIWGGLGFTMAGILLFNSSRIRGIHSGFMSRLGWLMWFFRNRHERGFFKFAFKLVGFAVQYFGLIPTHLVIFGPNVVSDPRFVGVP